MQPVNFNKPTSHTTPPASLLEKAHQAIEAHNEKTPVIEFRQGKTRKFAIFGRIEHKGTWWMTLDKTYQTIFQTALEEGAVTLAVPAFSTDFTSKKAAKIAIEAARDFISENPHAKLHIVFVVNPSDNDNIDAYQNALNDLPQRHSYMLENLSCIKSPIQDVPANMVVIPVDGGLNPVGEVYEAIEAASKESKSAPFTFDPILPSWADAPADTISETVSLNDIANHQALFSDAKELFNVLLNPQAIGQVSQDSPLAVGDLDGSVARLVLAGMYTGHIQVKKEGVDALIDLMNAEYCVLREHKGKPDFFGFQKSSKNSNLVQEGNRHIFSKNRDNLELLAANLSYHKGNRPLIFIGDIIFDRLTLDSATTIGICRSLFEKSEGSAVFILGNHDLYCPDEMDRDVQFGRNINLGEGVSWKDVRKIFVNAHFYQNKIYIHNGIKPDSQGNYKAFLGTISKEEIRTGQQLVNKINEQEIPTFVYQGVEQIDADILADSTHFRPKATDMQGPAESLGIWFVHGHNGIQNFSENSRVIEINSRSEDPDSKAQIYSISAFLVGTVNGEVQR